MPKVATHWSFHRYFPPLTRHSVFPPERAVTPPPLTRQKIFPREEPAVGENIAHAEKLDPVAAAPRKVLIPKPQGEVSRINWGSYNLQEKLGWPPAEYEEIRTFVVHLAQEHPGLMIRKSWSRQTCENLQVVFGKARERYPQLIEYEGNWVVADFLKMYLKNSSGRGG